MSTSNEERRRFKRIFFPAEEDILARLEIPSLSDAPATARIMDLSEEGLGISLIRDQYPAIGRGDYLVLKQIIRLEALDFLQDIRMEIKWILKHRSLDHVALGCQFDRPSQALRDKLIVFMESWGRRKVEANP